MFDEAHDSMKFDHRLRARHDWVSPDELAQELAALPDSADKAMEPGEEPAPKPSAESVAPPTPAPPVVEHEPVVESSFFVSNTESSPEAPAADSGLPQPTASFGGDSGEVSDTVSDTDKDFGGTPDA
ncbi:MAG: hypothetical protein VX246_03325 [Myxococcota bacterium]|nr:hypothetical protein [Myxococcota bacterium]